MGAAPGPCPAWRPKAQGLGRALTPWPPPQRGRGVGGMRVRAGGGAGRGGQRSEAREQRWSRIRGGVRAPSPGPELLGAERASRRGARAGHQSAASRGGRGVGAPALQATAPRLRPGESPGTLRSTSGVTGHSLWDQHSPRSYKSRPKGEAGRRSREPPAYTGACAQLGPGKGKPDGVNAQAQEGGAVTGSRGTL